MSIGFGTLKADVAAWLNRADLTAQIPAFVRLAEARFNRTLRVTAMMESTQTEANSSAIPLPDDWLESRDVQLDGAPVRYVTPEEASRLRFNSLATGELFFTLLDDTIELIPVPTAGTLTMAYYARIPPLSDSASSNWLLENHYDAYLYGSLMHSAPFLLEDERVPLWKAALDAALTEIQEADNRARHSGATLTSRRRPGYG